MTTQQLHVVVDTVVSIDGHLVALQFGSGQQERTILVVRGSIIRKVNVGDETDHDHFTRM